MSAPKISDKLSEYPPRLIDGHGSDRFRVRHGKRGDAPAVKVELVRPLAAHAADTLVSVGVPLLVPLDRVTALIEALDAVRREAMEGAANA